MIGHARVARDAAAAPVDVHVTSDDVFGDGLAVALAGVGSDLDSYERRERLGEVQAEGAHAGL